MLNRKDFVTVPGPVLSTFASTVALITVETATRYSLAMVLFMAAAISTATRKEGSRSP
jgi:hypothetical protein